MAMSDAAEPFIISWSWMDRRWVQHLSKSTCGCGAFEGPFLVKSLWIKLWNFAKIGCRNPGHVTLRLFGAGVMQPGQRELPLRSE
jgi:hypothetical protein